MSSLPALGSACELDWGLVGAALPRGLAALQFTWGATVLVT